MTISLVKGAKIDVAKAAADAGNTAGLDKVSFGFGWDTSRGTGPAYDLDGMVVACDDAGNAVPGGFLFYNTPGMACFGSAMVHSGDNLTGEGDGDDEVITVTLSQLPASVVDIRVYVAIHEATARGGQSFSVVDDAFVRLVDEASGQELGRFDLSEDTAADTNTICFAKLYKHNDAWQWKILAEESNTEIAGIVEAHKIQD